MKKMLGRALFGSQTVQELYEEKAGGIHNDVAARKEVKTVPDASVSKTPS